MLQSIFVGHLDAQSPLLMGFVLEGTMLQEVQLRRRRGLGCL